MDISSTKNRLLYEVVFLVLAILFCTYLRVLILVAYPLLVVGAFYFFRWKLNRNALYLMGWITLCWLLSFRHGIFLKYNILSLYYFIPFLFLAFAVPRKDESKIDHLRLLMNGLSVLVIVNDIFGIIQYIRKPGDDSFVGIYGIFTVSQNGLSLLNGLLFLYYLSIFQNSGKKISLFLSLFFIVCCVMGFYGAGQIVLISAVGLTYLKIKSQNIIQLILIICLTLGAIVFVMKAISPNTFDYNVAIIKKFVKSDHASVPRKRVIFENYFDAYTSNPADLLFGSGPGTFNSRSAFMVGSPYYFSATFIKSDVKPYYFQQYAYPLWNNTNTGPYDGFMNQPFTSILSLLGEYGLIFCGLFFTVLIVSSNSIYKNASRRGSAADRFVEIKMFRFCSIFVLLLIVVDNYIEYPEIIALLLIIIKLSQQRLKTY